MREPPAKKVRVSPVAVTRPRPAQLPTAANPRVHGRRDRSDSAGPYIDTTYAITDSFFSNACFAASAASHSSN